MPLSPAAAWKEVVLLLRRSACPIPAGRLVLLGLLSAILPAAGSGCTRREPPDGKIHLTYWEKWSRFEGEAMRRVVDAFNRSQDRIVVHMHTFGTTDRKTAISTAGGDPPDLAGLWALNIATFADQGILMSLDAYLERDRIPRDHWIPIYLELCSHRGRLWGLPTTPATVGLYWNKALFREAGLDPERPPQTLEELDDYARRMTRYDDQGNIIQMGFLPSEPDWFVWAYGPWFGGRLCDGGRITADDPGNVEAFAWIQKYTREYGLDRIKRFTSGFGNFASPQNAFFSGKVAMIFQGVWLYNYISQYAPGMQWGAAGWPKTPHGPPDFSVAECDVLAIPAGLPRERREAAWEFLKYVSSQPAMEMLNLGQRKNSPLTRISEDWLHHHPHPAIGLFIEMSRSPHVVCIPPLGVWREYLKELNAAGERVRLMVTNPQTGRPYTAAESLAVVQTRISRSHQRHEAAFARRAQLYGEPR